MTGIKNAHRARTTTIALNAAIKYQGFDCKKFVLIFTNSSLTVSLLFLFTIFEPLAISKNSVNVMPNTFDKFSRVSKLGSDKSFSHFDIA